MKPQRWIPKDSETFNHPDGLGVCYLAQHTTTTTTGPKTNLQVVGYSGRRNRPDHNYAFRDRAAALRHIECYFTDLTASAKYKSDHREARKNETSDPCNPSLTETAQLVREALATAFPKTKFSVRSDSYSMGCSIRVHWTDGPTQKQVDAILDPFEGASFDGMQDLKTYNGPSLYKGRLVHFGADYVQGSRSMSNELLRAAALRVAFECDLPLLMINDRGSIEGGEYRVPWRHFQQGDEEGFSFSQDEAYGEWYSQLVYQTAHATSTEETQPVELPVLQTKEEKPQSDDARLAKVIWGEESAAAKEFESTAIQSASRMVN